MKSLKQLRIDDAVKKLRECGPISCSNFGWEMWGETTEQAMRGEGSHRQNKFCRSAGKLLNDLKRRGLAEDFIDGPIRKWRVIG